ncbi:flagellar FlbD family protein [Brevibacillus sp. B_LB10_24]|uniref:flagellar FlbD family protein n=1 Tax=Brevibacillus sp. B_LB10_24 TaxID=3380645 RepID=UPI0038BDDF58
MVFLTRFNGTTFYLNITHIESVESTPDTVITLTSGKKYIVKEAAEEIAARITSFYQAVPMASTVSRSTSESDE